MEKKISLAKFMPLTIAIISGTFVASYMFTGLSAEASIGRPSSTAAIGYIFAPIYSLIIAGIGYIIGLILRFFLNKLEEKYLVKKSTYIISVIVITILTGSYSANTAINEVIDYEAFNSPHLLSNNANFNKTSYSENEIPSVTKHAELVWEYDNTSMNPLLWNSLEITTKVQDSTQLSILSKDTKKATYNFQGYTYITEIRILPVTNEKHIKYLAVLVRLRSTSRRSMLLIYDQSFNLIYEELLDRCGRNQYMGSSENIEGEVIVVNICKPFIINVNK